MTKKSKTLLNPSDFCTSIEDMKFDKNTILGLLFMLLLAFGFSWYSANEAAKEQEQTQENANSNAAPEQQATQSQPTPQPNDNVVTEPSGLNTDRYASLAASASKSRFELVTLKNDKVSVQISTKGGHLHRATLNEFTKYGSDKHIELWDTTNTMMNLNWKNGKGETVQSSELYFEPNATQVDATSQKGEIRLKAKGISEGQYMEWVYTLEPNSYQVQCQLNIVGLENEVFNSPLELDWKLLGHTNEKGLQTERSKSSIFFHTPGEDRDYLSETGNDSETLEVPLHWVDLKQNYFSVALISDNGFDKGAKLDVYVLQDSTSNKLYYAKLPLTTPKSNNAQLNFSYYLGPNSYDALSATNIEEFTNIIDYGWWIIGYVNKYAIRPLFEFLAEHIGTFSYGLIIFIVTLLIKMLLFPITWKNFLSGAKMRVLKPEIDEINKKYEGKEAVEKQQATMALYRQTGVNPFAGCIPVLLQMPILYAMFRFFPAEITLRGKSFLWADDLAAYDSILDLSFNIPMYGSHVSGFTLLMAASTFLYSKMSMGSQPTMTQPGMPNMAVMMNIFSFMMIFFFNSMPAGLTMYYFTANMISIGQMWAIKKYFIDENAIRAKIEENKKKPKKKGGLASRIEEMQKAQQAKLDAQKSKLKKK